MNAQQNTISLKSSTQIGGEFRLVHTKKDGTIIKEYPTQSNLITNYGFRTFSRVPSDMTWSQVCNVANIADTAIPSGAATGMYKLFVGNGTGISNTAQHKLFNVITWAGENNDKVTNSVEYPTEDKHPNFIKLTVTHRYDVQVFHQAVNLTELGIGRLQTSDSRSSTIINTPSFFEKGYIDGEQDSHGMYAYCLTTHAFILNDQGQRITVSLQPDEYLIVYYSLNLYIDTRPYTDTASIKYVDELNNVTNDTLDVLYQNFSASGLIGNPQLPMDCCPTQVQQFATGYNATLISEERKSNFQNSAAVSEYALSQEDLAALTQKNLSNIQTTYWKTRVFDLVPEEDAIAVQTHSVRDTYNRQDGRNVYVSNETSWAGPHITGWVSNWLTASGAEPNSVPLRTFEGTVEGEPPEYAPAVTITNDSITRSCYILAHPFIYNIKNYDTNKQCIRGIVYDQGAFYYWGNGANINYTIFGFAIFRNQRTGRGIEKTPDYSMIYKYETTVTRYTGTP